MQKGTEQKKGYKKTKLGWIPEDWEVKLLKNIGRIGSGNTPSKQNKEYWINGTIPWLPTGKVNDQIITSSETFITDFAVKEKSIKLLPVDSVLIAMVGQGKTRGKAALLKINAWINQNFAYIIPNTIIKSDFLHMMLDYYYQRIRYEGNRGGSQGSLNTSMIKFIKIPVPAIKEQIEIANCLNTWDNTILNLTTLVAKKEHQKKGLMQQLLTRKTRLKGFNEDWKEYSFKSILREVKRPVNWNDDELYKLISVKRRSGGLFHRESLHGHQIKTKNLRTALKGDLLISKMQILHGASGLVTEEFDNMKISGSYLALRAADKEVLNMEYLDWYTKLPYFYHQCYRSSYGVHIEKMTFNFKLFLKEKIVLPKTEEQEAIINVLNSAEDEIVLLNKKLDQLKDQKKGLMQQLLTGKKRLKF
jgi:type I restriction enzyme S subunit